MSDDDLSLSEAERSAGIVRCDACPVLCRIRPGRAGACGRSGCGGGPSAVRPRPKPGATGEWNPPGDRL